MHAVIVFGVLQVSALAGVGRVGVDVGVRTLSRVLHDGCVIVLVYFSDGQLDESFCIAMILPMTQSKRKQHTTAIKIGSCIFTLNVIILYFIFYRE